MCLFSFKQVVIQIRDTKNTHSRVDLRQYHMVEKQQDDPLLPGYTVLKK